MTPRRILLGAILVLAVLLCACVTIDTGGSYDGITDAEHDHLYQVTTGKLPTPTPTVEVRR